MPHPTVQDHIDLFTKAAQYADANGHGNAHGVLLRIIRDLETLKTLPDEAFLMEEAEAESEGVVSVDEAKEMLRKGRPWRSDDTLHETDEELAARREREKSNFKGLFKPKV